MIIYTLINILIDKAINNKKKPNKYEASQNSE